MHSVKRGRGPSLIGAIVGIGMLLFAITMFSKMSTVTAGIGGSVRGISGSFFGLFIFVLILIIGWHLFNAVARNRPREYDMTSQREEPDPLNEALGDWQVPKRPDPPRAQDSSPPPPPPDVYVSPKGYRHCPGCGLKLQPGFEYCPDCGTDV